MSIWNKDIKREVNSRASEDKSCDVLVIGGGMTGLNTAYYLKDFKNVVVIDANSIGYGVTNGSTAKINYLQSGMYNKIKRFRGDKVAEEYLKSQRYGVLCLKEIIESENIDCSFKKVSSYIFASNEEEINAVEKEVSFLLSKGIDIKKSKFDKLSHVKDAYRVEDTYVFNPIKYLMAIKGILEKNKVPVYENTKVLKIQKVDDQYVCFTENAKICARNVVLATWYPYFTVPFFLPFKSYIEKSYIVVSKVKKGQDLTYINTKSPIYSCRFYEDKDNVYQISLSESHNISFKLNDYEHFKNVKKRFKLKGEDIVLMYSNVDVMTPDGLPYVGKIKNNMYIATGFNTWGMTNSAVAASVISDNILGNKNRFMNLFDPTRLTLAQVLYFPYIVFSQSKSFLESKIFKSKSWYSKRVINVKEGGINYGIYIDSDGKTHRVINKCPHLGCSLIFNEVEKTWDCPCHASRFDVDGHCIKGPSNYDISCKKNTPKE